MALTIIKVRVLMTAVSGNPRLKAPIIDMITEITLMGTVGISAMRFFYPTRNTFLTVRFDKLMYITA